ncbi:LPXTG cell wall anchor domain-containing protein [Schumannella soli]|uniref:LPXTG cell wall anchor domain-containing protein n=1 Tax=Schumannella soli TaxID=2590779 RepID=A0A506XXF5_9MICO|nr:LPXTG cell wall anchor domain-containing protein [Schumannella soli]TPW74475.1 LPXTG cell wall anchor domain-containing protein [Schumannella soli]
MKITRLLAASTGIAIAGALVATALPASANPGDVYVTADQIGVEGDSYPAQWFAGEQPTGTPAATVTSDAYGLSVDGRYQLLNGANLGTGTSIEDLVGSAKVIVSRGNAAFQIPIFAHPDSTTQKGFTTLRPASFNTPTVSAVPGVDQQWVTSGAIRDADGNIVYAGGSTDTLANLLAAVGTEYQILASGVFLNPGEVNSIAAITWNGETTRFTKQAAPQQNVTTITQQDFEITDNDDNGVFALFTGLIPGETVQVTLDDEPQADEVAEELEGEGVLGYQIGSVDGVVAPGTYTVVATGVLSGVVQSIQFTVTGAAVTDPGTIGGGAGTAPAAAVQPTLAETGVEANMGLLTAAVLVLAGLTMVLVRRRAAIAND